MKLSTVAKLTCKSVAIRVLAAATLAGAVLAATPAAQAQHFAVGVRIGGPAFYAPPPRVELGYRPGVYGYGPGFYDHRRFEDFRAHEAFVRHEEWDHAHFGYGRR